MQQPAAQLLDVIGPSVGKSDLAGLVIEAAGLRVLRAVGEPVRLGQAVTGIDSVYVVG